MIKLIKKKKFSFFTFAVMGILILEVLAFGMFNYQQPSYKTEIANVLKRYEDPEGGFYTSLQNKQATLNSTYAALTINSILNNTLLLDSTNLTGKIMSHYDNSTGLFFDNDELSLSATYNAIGSLSHLHELSKVNSSKTVEMVLKLQSNDSLFKDYNEINEKNASGDLNHLFEAVFIINKLSTGSQGYFQNLNRSKILGSLLSLQVDGGFRENNQNQIPNMQTAFYVTETLADLGSNLTYYESLGFLPGSLIHWIEQMYTGNGFKDNQNSIPSAQTTALALISLLNLGVSPSQIQSNYDKGIDLMLSSISTNYFQGNSVNTLDSLSFILVALKDLGGLNEISQIYLEPAGQEIFGLLIVSTIIALLVLILLTIIQVLREDESKYYETALKTCIHTVYDSHGTDLARLSYLLGETITKVVFRFPESSDSYASLRAESEEYDFTILYETFSWYPKELTKYEKGTRQALVGLNFMDKEVLYTIEEALEVLKQN